MYTYAINFYKNAGDLGWVFCTFRTTDDAVRLHLKSLIRQKQAGKVRAIEAIKLK